MRICSGSGCLRAVNDDVRFCDDCKPAAAVSDDIRSHTLSDREKYGFLYSSHRWQRVRDLAIKACPLCARCELRVSAIVDHIVPSGVAIMQAIASGLYKLDKWAGFFFRSNLQGLCRECHYVKTMEDKTHVGEWPDVVDIERRSKKRTWTF